MTNDYQLFPDSGDGGSPEVDADVALITAYLARELSLVQVIAVEERLVTDAEFRETARPIIESWFVPGSFPSSSIASTPPTAGASPVTPTELEAGWQRYLSGAARATGANRL